MNKTFLYIYVYTQTHPAYLFSDGVPVVPEAVGRQHKPELPPLRGRKQRRSEVNLWCEHAEWVMVRWAVTWPGQTPQRSARVEQTPQWSARVEQTSPAPAPASPSNPSWSSGDRAAGRNQRGTSTMPWWRVIRLCSGRDKYNWLTEILNTNNMFIVVIINSVLLRYLLEEGHWT